MMYVDPTSQYKFVAKSTPPLATSDTTSTNNVGDNAAGSAAENIVPVVVQAPPNNATHFQAPEHAQKQAALAQNAANSVVPVSPSQVVPPAGQVLAPGQAAGIPGQGLTYDGKRMRKTMQRRTVDYNSSVIRFLETRKWFKSSRNQHALQPQEIYNIDVVPPCGYIKNPMNSVTTKFVRTSTNKLRCPIFCVVWTPEGRRLVTGASSGEFTLWNGLTFNFETILQAHDRAVRSMVWSHNDLWLLTGDHGGFVKYWQSNMNNVKMYEAHKEPVRGLSFSPSDNKFASCSDDGLVKVWDFYRCAEERELKGHGADVKCVDWHPSKGLIVSGSKDSQQPVKLWDPRTGNSITTLHCHKSTVMAAKWNSNGNWLVTGSRDHLLKLFDIRMMKELQAFRGHKKEATVVAWHPVHETLFASGGSDGSLMFWLTGVDEKAGGMEKAHEGIVWSLSWHPLGHILCSGSNDHTSKFWARNRPGDAMTDKYNLDIQGSQEDGEDGEEATSQTSVPALAAYDASQVIPGVGLPVTRSNIVLPDAKDVDAHLYGESSKDKRKTTITQLSTTASSEFPYPPAFRASNLSAFDSRYGSVSQGIPGLDISNTGAHQENEGYKVPHFPGQPKLRLPTRLPTSQTNAGNHLPHPGNIPPLSNRPPFGPGPRHSFDYRGPPGPRGPDANYRPSGQFQGNQYMRFPPPQGPGGPRGSFGPRTGPGGPHAEPWGGPHHPGPRGGSFDPHRAQDNQRSQNMPPDYYGQRGGLQEGPRPHGGPISPHVRPDGQHGGPRPSIPTSQHGPMDSLHGGPVPRGPTTDPNLDSSKPPLNLPSGLPAGPHSRRPLNDHNARLDDSSPYDQGGPRDGPKGRSSDGQLEASHGGSNQADIPPAVRGSNPLNSNVRPDDPHASLRPLLDVPSQGARPSSTGSNARLDRPRGGPRPLLNIPSGSENFGPRTANDNGHSFGTRGPRPPHFQSPRSDQPKPELKSPEGEKRGGPEPRENVLRRSRDSSPRNSPPVSASNHAKQERRTSDPDAPGILGDFQTHLIKEVGRSMLEVGRLFGQTQAEIARHDRPPHGRSDADRPIGRTRDRDKSEGDQRGDRPPYESHDKPGLPHPGHRPPRDRPGDHDRDRPPSDRPDMVRREDRSSHDRSDMGRSRDRSVYEGRPRDRPRGSPQDRADVGQPGHRPSFDRQDSGRQSDRSFSDENDVPAHEKPGLLPIPDMFLARGPLSADGPPRDPGSAQLRPPDRRRDHGRFQDGRNDNPGFSRGPRDHNPPEMPKGSTKSGGGRNDGPPPANETSIKPLMSLLDAPPVNRGSPPGLGGVEGRGRKRSMEQEFDRPPKRMGMGDNRERPR